MKRPVGFTLVEMLVVVAILALLTAILLPVLLQAQAKSRQSACLSNMRQLIIAFRLYADNHDERLPGTTEWTLWGELSRRGVLPVTESLGCPNVPQGREAINFIFTRYGERLMGVPGYGYNQTLQDGSYPDIPGRKYSEIIFPSTTVCLSETALGVDLEVFPPGPDPYFYNFDSGMYPYDQERAWERHQGGSNYAFCDGHVKWLRAEGVRNAREGNDGKTPSFDYRLEGTASNYPNYPTP
jgi:prepilin-type processing-associated H-X9-DG protein/prepilin-type N-terminal cleavage/methylation domain-containing protein